jgi:hypothetical protein
LTFQILDEQHREWFIVGFFFQYTLSLDTIEDCVAIKSLRNFYEIGSIPCRIKWCKYGSSSVTDSNIDHSIAGTCERKIKM